MPNEQKKIKKYGEAFEPICNEIKRSIVEFGVWRGGGEGECKAYSVESLQEPMFINTLKLVVPVNFQRSMGQSLHSQLFHALMYSTGSIGLMESHQNILFWFNLIRGCYRNQKWWLITGHIILLIGAATWTYRVSDSINRACLSPAKVTFIFVNK